MLGPCPPAPLGNVDHVLLVTQSSLGRPGTWSVLLENTPPWPFRARPVMCFSSGWRFSRQPRSRLFIPLQPVSFALVSGGRDGGLGRGPEKVEPYRSR